MLFASLPSATTLLMVTALSRSMPHAAATPCVPASIGKDTITFDTTQIVLTTQDFKQLSTFLTAVASDLSRPDVQRIAQTYLVTYPLALGQVTVPDQMSGAGLASPLKTGVEVQVPNYTMMADSVPVIAKSLATAQLTGPRYLRLIRTLNNAYVTDQIDRRAHNDTSTYTDTNTVIGKNVAFLHTHAKEFQTFVGLGLDVTKVLTNAATSADKVACHAGMDFDLAVKNNCVKMTPVSKTTPFGQP